jgi:predicted metal-dependent phosphoesterase TrpH
MPARQPFTSLCQALARGRAAGRADLHVHTCFSDGTYTPAEVVDLARRGGLAAVAVTDHDTLGGVEGARSAAQGAIEIIAGVEITTEFRQRELHLLAYFVDVENAAVRAALEGVRRERAARFLAMTQRLRDCGVPLPEEELRRVGAPEALGRRHLAEAMVRAGRAPTVREAFRVWLGDGGRAAVPKRRLPIKDALVLVRGAGGVGSWAHPGQDCDPASLAELRDCGLGAIEVEYPDMKPSRSRQLREWAERLGLAVTGGSDCHGPGRREVGCRTINDAELERLRRGCAR